MPSANSREPAAERARGGRPAPRAQPGTRGSPTEQGASRGPRGPPQYNLEGLGIIGQPHRDLRPQGAATQSTGTGCIVHPTQVHAFTVGASCPLALSRALYTVPWTRGRWSRPTDRPSGGGPGLELYYGLRGGIFIAEVTSINPFTTHSARQSGAAAAALCSAPALSLPLPLSPSAGQAFLPPLPCDFFFSPPLGTGPSPAVPHLFQATPHLTLTLTSQSNNFKSWTGHLSICWVATLSHQSGLDPRPSILEAL